MDLVLEILDERLLDSVWAYLKPLHVPLADAQLLTNAKSAWATSVASAIPTAARTVVSSSLAALATQAPLYGQQQSAEEWTTISAWPRDDWRRQTLSLIAITLIGIHLMYFTIAGASYKWLFDHRMMQHPRFIKGQIGMEIKSSLIAFPTLTLLTVPWFVGEARGWSLCYDSIEKGPGGGGLAGWAYLIASALFFLFVTDLSIYFIHRWEHHPSVYKHIHKPHHRWVIPTPWASHAFHPIDGYAQSLPYHIFIYIVPLHKMLFIGLFAFVNLWTILIHDSDMIVDHPLENVINGPAHHTLHHLYFTCNYGQYFTWADKYWDSYRHPAKGDDPLLVVLARSEKVKSQKAAEEVCRQEEEQRAALLAAEPDKAVESKKEQ